MISFCVSSSGKDNNCLGFAPIGNALVTNPRRKKIKNIFIFTQKSVDLCVTLCYNIDS